MTSDRLTDAQVVADHNDLEMLRRPHLWPYQVKGRPMICVRRYPHDGSPEEFGRCYLNAVEGLVVRERPIGAIRRQPGVAPARHVYGDAETAIGDRWVVD